MSRDYCDHAPRVSRPELRHGFRGPVKPDRGDVRTGNALQDRNSSKRLVVHVHVRVRSRSSPVKTRFAPIAEEGRSQIVNELVRGGGARRDNLLLGDHLRIWSEVRAQPLRAARRQCGEQERPEPTRWSHMNPRMQMLCDESVAHLPHRVKKNNGPSERRPVVLINQPGKNPGNPRQVQPVGLVIRASHSACGIGITFATNWPG
jgi:hypothetical protein